MREFASAARAGAVRVPAREPLAHERRAQWLLGLKQTSGNAAVTRLVQRAPGDRPASTDVAGPRRDIHARIIGMSIVNSLPRITIASGTEQGVEAGMKGAIADFNGAPYVGFTIETAEMRVSSARLNDSTVGEVEQAAGVVIRVAASQASATTGGKEF